MADERDDGRTARGEGTSDYSATKAPETAREAEEPDVFSDYRLIPGGRRGARVEIGISALDRADVPSGALNPGLEDFGRSPRAEDA